jgi:hypothetical protein
MQVNEIKARAESREDRADMRLRHLLLDPCNPSLFPVKLLQTHRFVLLTPQRRLGFWRGPRGPVRDNCVLIGNHSRRSARVLVSPMLTGPSERIV